MKNLKTIIAVVALSLATVLPATANTNIKPAKKNYKTTLRTEIVSLLGQHEYKLNKTLEAQVSIMLNNDNELVVLEVASKDTSIANFVKSKLNYKKLKAKGIKKGTIYRIPLKMVQSK
ncbi:MAG: hypothetical protein HWD85_01115 [Flavobacteriaceae bacterium]|nr:hypothetical protein [Flavobacteriaceae bacterium]